MPQLVKGGKYAFSWSHVGDGGQIVVPPEALQTYHLQESEKLILMPGSRTSGGFSLGSKETVKGSPIGSFLNDRPELDECRIPEGEAITYNGKSYCWVELRHGRFILPANTLEKYGIRIGDRLLVVKGSGLAVAFIVRGPIVEEARRHPELMVFPPGA
jgi:bifunctional DNA-binding transcriptional regulator/antitoxin component of YhaV-PrlF toxin-antitoxin module